MGALYIAFPNTQKCAFSRSITVALRLLVAMPPKVKSLESMAAAEVEETQATQPADQLTPNLTQTEDPNAGPSPEAPKQAVMKSKKLRIIATTLAVETVDVM